LLERYAKQVSATMTVAPALAQRYQEEFGFRPTVVFNVPYYDNPPPDHNVDSQMIRLVHVGTALRNRQIELMIDTIRYCDQRYYLFFVLLPYYRDPRYIHYLQLYAQNVAPGRISFLEPTMPDQIVHRIASFDMGIYLLKPTSYNHSIALPNKLFQFLHAGLAVCIGPTPGMAAFVKEWQFGIVAPSFDPKIVAATLNQLDTKEIERMRQAARTAAVRFSAATEMEKVVNLCHQLLEQKSKIRGC
jgi:glycosyltransferase involved in cell wall biosynthesis